MKNFPGLTAVFLLLMCSAPATLHVPLDQPNKEQTEAPRLVPRKLLQKLLVALVT